MDKSISLQGFKDFDPTEIDRIQSIVEKSLVKVQNKIDYNSLKITLKQHRKQTEFIHELTAEIFRNKGKSIYASMTHKNPFLAMTRLMDKIITEVRKK
ncbi:MAG: hypothetical protein ABH817_02650 [archaeon]